MSAQKLSTPAWVIVVATTAALSIGWGVDLAFHGRYQYRFIALEVGLALLFLANCLAFARNRALSKRLSQRETEWEQHAAALVKQGEEKLQLAIKSHQEEITKLALPQDSEIESSARASRKIATEDAEKMG